MTFSAKDRKFMDDAISFARNHSKDRSTRVGALILGADYEPLSWGYNGFPRGVNDDVEDRHERPAKYKWTEHSERNAIYNAARSGIRLLGSRIYVTSLTPCNDCARAIVQAGVKEVYIEACAFDTSNPRVQAWLPEWPITKTIFEEGGVQIIIEGKENES